MGFTLAAAGCVSSDTFSILRIPALQMRVAMILLFLPHSHVQRIGAQVSRLGVAPLVLLAPSPQGGSGKSLRCVGPEAPGALQKMIHRLEESHGRSRIGLNPCKERQAERVGGEKACPISTTFLSGGGASLCWESRNDVRSTGLTGASG